MAASPTSRAGRWTCANACSSSPQTSAQRSPGAPGLASSVAATRSAAKPSNAQWRRRSDPSCSIASIVLVVFQPFDREQMRARLAKELDDVLTRRGLRTRPWAIEYDDSAIAVLMERGFTTDLGARPLKRAVEQLLLSPARAIVEHTAPSGEQFLFVSAQHGEIEVRFVDPNAAPDGNPLTRIAKRHRPRALFDVRKLALQAGFAAPAQAQSLLDELRRISDEIRC